MIKINMDEKALRKKSEKIDFKDAKKIISDLQSALGHIGSRGIGLCGPQIYEYYRVAFFNYEGRKITMVNPKIVDKSKEKWTLQEGCLSLPRVSGTVERPMTITLEYVDYKGDKQKEEFTGMLARAIQHELDHFEGILITDY